MHYLVDYLSFTVPTGKFHFLLSSSFQRDVLSRVSAYLTHPIMAILFDGLPDAGPKFAPYTHGFQDATTKTVVMAHPDLSHILVQIPGYGCAALTEVGMMSHVLSTVRARCTRIDITADIETDTYPVLFVQSRTNGRFQYMATMSSPSGESIYIGSPTSERRAIVYRYAEPHPRHRYLRVEHRYSGDRAKEMATYTAIHGVPMAVRLSGETFGWKHPEWDPVSDDCVPLPRSGVAERDSAEVIWVLKQVIPALKRYEREGKIEDLRAFLEQYLFGEDAGSP